MAVRMLVAGFCVALALPAQSKPASTQAQKEWALGAGAILAQMDDERLDLLGGAENVADVAAMRRQELQASWGIQSRADLLGVTEELSRDDSDRMRVAWNLVRLINVARWGFAAGFLQEDEAWSLIQPAAQRLQKTFSSWQELGQVYLNARVQWFERRLAYRRQAEYAYRELLFDQQSPWRKYPWSLDLGNGYAAPPSIEKTARLELAAHPEGLMCVRITIPDHRDAVEYEAAIESAVGCRPYVKERRRDGADWILFTECMQPGTLHGAEIIARFQPEAIAQQLRRDGVTQLFTIFEHQPHGSATELSPYGFDDWFSNGWQWYFDQRSLRQPFPETTLTYGVPPAGVRTFVIGALMFAVLSLAGAFAARGRPWWMTRFPLFYWGLWLVLSVTYYGLAVAGFWSGGEGLGADVRGLVWYGTLALLLRCATEFILAQFQWSGAGLPSGRILYMSFCRAVAEVPIAIVLVLLCDPQRPINLATVIALLGIGAAIALIAWNFRMRAEGLQGGLAMTGDLLDAIRATAKRMGAPLRRVYILPEGNSPRLGPKAGTHGDLLIPERLLHSAYRREVDGIVAYQLMLIKTRYLNSFWTGLLPVAVILVWRVYNAQNAPSANMTLMAQAGMAVSAFAAFGQTLRRIQARALNAFQTAQGDAEGWIAGLARIARLTGTEVRPEVTDKIARQCGVSLEHLPKLVKEGFPESGRYAIPYYDRQKLVSVS